MDIIIRFLEKLHQGAQGRDVPDHGQGSEFRMERKGQLPVHRQLIDRGMLGCLNIALRYSLRDCLGNNCRVLGIEENTSLCGVKFVLFLDGGCRGNLICIVENDTDIAYLTHTGISTKTGHSRFNSRIAENTFFRSPGLPVEINLFIWTT